MNWHVIFVQTGYEDEVCYYINDVLHSVFDELEFNLLVPKRKIYERKQGVRREVVKSLFPGYVLVETDNILDFYVRVRGRPRVYKVLRDYDYFYTVRDEEMAQVLAMVNDNGLIDISEAFYVNDRVQILNGPLWGREGIIRKIDKRKGRAKVEFRIDKKTYMIDLGIKILPLMENLYSADVMEQTFI